MCVLWCLYACVFCWALCVVLLLLVVPLWFCFAGLLLWLLGLVAVLTCEVLVPVVPAQYTTGMVLILCVYQPLN